MAFASEAIIQVLNRVKPPYHLNPASQQLAITALESLEQVNQWTRQATEEREKLAEALASLPRVEKIYPSEANFLLVKTRDTEAVYRHLIATGIVVRDRSRVLLCEGCLRITIGTPSENTTDRKSVVEGKRGSVRVDLGGRRIIKKKKTNKNH